MLQTATQTAEALTELVLAFTERARRSALALLLTVAATTGLTLLLPVLAALPLLALTLSLTLALSTLALLLAASPFLALLSAGAVGVVHQALLLANQVTELIEHLHHFLAATVLLLLLLAACHAA